MYILLGEPRGREQFDLYNNLVTTELWFYQGDTDKGIPRFFNLVFYKPQDVGVFRLYSPALDRPGALLRGQAGAQPQLAFDNLYRISPDLARAAITFDASEPIDRNGVSTAMLGTEAMMARIEESPKRAVRTDYLDGWFRYGNRVSADYSFNYVPSRSTFAVLLGPERTSFLHYAVEIDFENFPMETDPDQTTYYTTLDVSLEVRDRSGTLVIADEKESYVELTPSQIEASDGTALSYQDGVPLVPGDYTVTVIVRNRMLQQYTVAETQVRVESVTPAVSDLVLGFSVEEEPVTASDPSPTLETFEVSGTRVHPAASGLFAVGDTAYVFLQVREALPEHSLSVQLLDGETVLREHSISGAELDSEPVVQLLSLADMYGGSYEVRADLVDAAGQVLVRRTAPISLSPRTNVPRPAFTARRNFDPEEPGLLAMTVGDQLWSLGRYEDARAKLEEAVAANNPDLPMAKWKLAGAYVRDREGARALELLVPLEPEFPQQYEVVLGLGLAYYLEGELEKAAELLERAMTIRAPGTNLLNALADVYLTLGTPEKARPLLERSLELDGTQESVQRKLSALPSG